MNSIKSESLITELAAKITHIHSPGRILALGLALGLLADLLLVGKPLGIGLLIFVLLAVGALGRIGQLEGVTAVRRNGWLLLPLFFFASMVFLRTNPVLTMLNVLAVVCLLAYLVFFWANGRVSGLGLVDMSLLPLRVGGQSAILTPPLLGESVAMGVARRYGRRGFFPVMRGALIAAPILFIFTILLAAADTIFAYTVETAFSLDIFSYLGNWLWRGSLVLLAAWFISGGLALAVQRRHGRDDQGWLDSAIHHIPYKISLGMIETTTMLMLVNVLFTVFVTIQFAYLFGGRVNINLEGFTYADYARRGFFELLTVAILSVGLILGLNWLTRRESKGQIHFFNMLSTVLILFVLVLLLSAFWRMMLYEAAFGYTELRLIVYLFIGWLGLLLLWFLATLWRRPDQFAIGALFVVIGFLMTLNLLNPDQLIARQNLQRYSQTGDLDAVYLTTLSDDAMPQLLQAIQLTAADTTEQLIPRCANYYWRSDVGDDCYATATEILQAELDGRYQSRQEDSSWRAWQSFNLARWRAFAQLQ